MKDLQARRAAAHWQGDRWIDFLSMQIMTVVQIRDSEEKLECPPSRTWYSWHSSLEVKPSACSSRCCRKMGRARPRKEEGDVEGREEVEGDVGRGGDEWGKESNGGVPSADAAAGGAAELLLRLLPAVVLLLPLSHGTPAPVFSAPCRLPDAPSRPACSSCSCRAVKLPAKPSPPCCCPPCSCLPSLRHRAVRPATTSAHASITVERRPNSESAEERERRRQTCMGGERGGDEHPHA